MLGKIMYNMFRIIDIYILSSQGVVIEMHQDC